jgi:hypothetical protein
MKIEVCVISIKNKPHIIWLPEIFIISLWYKKLKNKSYVKD